jgi:uncharacterized protein YycO
MKKIYIIILVCSLIILAICGLYFTKKYYNPGNPLNESKEQVEFLIDNKLLNDGDIIFQTSLSQQSKAIQLATHSKYSHCGIIYKIKNDYFVFEAIQTVKLTPLSKWIIRGEGSHYVIKRLKNADSLLSPDKIKVMKKVGEYYKGKPYDIYFDWSDKKIYCSELVWKIYKKSIGIEIGELQKLQDFDLSSGIVQNILKKRYGQNIPLDEIVISPGNIFDSELLETIGEK